MDPRHGAALEGAGGFESKRAFIGYPHNNELGSHYF
jgi:hypothetical protein